MGHVFFNLSGIRFLVSKDTFCDDLMSFFVCFKDINRPKKYHFGLLLALYLIEKKIISIKIRMLGNLFNSFHSKKENNETKIKHNFLKKDKNKKEDSKNQPKNNEVNNAHQDPQDINFE